jgi:hypothetical protein
VISSRNSENGEEMPGQVYLDSILEGASADFKRANPDLPGGDTGPVAKLERTARHGALGKGQVQAKAGRRFLVRVTSYRSRLLDEDNLAEKYHVDLCRYAGCLPSDAPGTATIETAQVKTGKGEQEKVVVEVYRL